MNCSRFTASFFAILLCVFPSPPQTALQQAESVARSTPLILEKDQGEKRVRRPVAGFHPAASTFYLKVDPKNGGSSHLVMGIEEINSGGAIAMHKHLAQDEILYLENGSARVTLGDREQDVHGGATIFIPQNTWISLRNIGPESIRLVFVFSSLGYESYMRCTSVPFGQPVAPMSPKERSDCMAPGDVMYK